MLTTPNIRIEYDKIQRQLFYMIPEKWETIYLYASVVDHFKVQTGEMFFYYYPKSILKRNPVNVYEVPNKFNIDEKAYLKLAENLYKEIKNLREELIKIGEKPWSNLTIIIKDFKFTVEYGYENLINSKYNSYERHLIWRYEYLNIPLTSYSKKDRIMLEEYLANKEVKNKNVTTYQEGIYKKPISNIIEYNNTSQTKEDEILKANIEKEKIKNENHPIIAQPKEMILKDYMPKSQILNRQTQDKK